MNRPLRITFLTFGTLLLLAILGLALVPLLFEDRIIELVRSELNERVDATIDFEDVDLTLLSTFPHLTVEISNLEITGKGEFEGTQLLSARAIRAGVGLFTLITQDNIEIESIEIEEPRAHVVITEEGAANYDIVAETPESVEPTAQALDFEIKHYQVDDGAVLYEQPGVRLTVDGLSHVGHLRVAGPVQTLSSETKVEAISAKFGGIQYLKKAKGSVDLDATLQSKQETLRIDQMAVAINELALGGSGSIGWGGDGLAVDVELASEQGLPVKALVSAVPNAYAADFKGMKTSGSFTIEAQVKGQLGPEDDQIPPFSVQARVRNGSVKYPDLPLALTDLELDAKAEHPGGNLDKLIVDVSKYAIAAGQSRAAGHLRVSRPLSQPHVDLLLDGRFDLAEIAKAYPIPDVAGLTGLIEANVDLSAKGQQIAKLTGKITAKDVAYRASGSPEVRISTARVVLSPDNTKIEELRAEVGSSDVSVEGVASPLTTFFSDEQKVTASASLTSKRLRVEDFLGKQQAKQEQVAPPAFVLPANLDAKLDFDVETLTYGDLELRNFKGTGRIKNQKLILDGIRANALGGSMRLDGTLTTKPHAPPAFEMSYSVDRASFAQAFQALPSMRAYAPIARFLDGRFSTNLSVNGTLNDDLEPKLDSIDASGLVAAVQSKLSSDFKPLQALNQAVPAIPRPLDIGSFKTRFSIHDGAVEVKPFTVTAKGLAMQVSGRHGLDQEMKYQVSTDVPIQSLTSKLTSEVRRLGIDLSKAKKVAVQANLTGSIKSPRVSVSVDTSALRSAAAEALSEKLAEERTRAIQEAKAQADRLVADAKKKANRIREEAKQAAEKLRKEGYARADQLEREAKGNPLKELAAKEGAKRIRSETDKRVNQMIAEADRRADQAVAEAQKRASQLVAEAESKSQEAAKAVEGQSSDKIR
jgi:vacuolar-type H+-ATPase subunit H